MEHLEIFDQLVSLISNVGFPIFCVVVLFKQQDKEREDHKNETLQFTDAINEMKNLLVQIKEMIVK